MKVTYTEEAVADIVQAITYLNERNPTAAAKLDADSTRCIERLADGQFEGPLSRVRSGAVVRSWGVPPFRIEIMTAIDGVTYRECWNNRQTFDMDGVAVPVISLADLKTNKRAAGRHKDLNDLENLP